MGILDSGLFGPFRKKVGPAIGRKHMGQDLVLPLYHKTTKKPTNAQLSEQSRFGLLNGFLSDITILVAPGFKKYAKKKSALNAAFSYNYGHAFLPEEGTWTLNYPALVYSLGDTATPDGLMISAQANVVSFSWSAQPQSLYCQFTDLASFLVYCPEKKTGIVRQAAAARHLLGFDVQVPNDFRGPLHCYISFSSADGKIAGKSRYAGALTIG